MAVAIEDAGFQIRDQIMWVYGSGFPKSHNISKGIDKAAGAEREVIGKMANPASSIYSQSENEMSRDVPITAPATAAAQQWNGWGTALKPAHEPIVLARKPLEGTVANNVLTFGVGGLNIDGTRVGTTVETWPASRSYAPGQLQPGGNGETQATGDVPAGRFPANFIHDGSDEVVALFPDTKSPKTYLRSSKATANIDWNPKEADTEQLGFGDSGSAARFFYCAKASKRDRNEGLEAFEDKPLAFSNQAKAELARGNVNFDGGDSKGHGNKIRHLKNHHPTVKPVMLMQYLVRLVTPPNGIVLDPFMGSGSTGKACAYEGFEFIGIDQSAEYVAIAQARIDFALSHKSDELPL
jgi:site-specific DNA-methyltransferase (adenine-specific)